LLDVSVGVVLAMVLMMYGMNLLNPLFSQELLGSVTPPGTKHYP
jgi:hypothetical protein